LRCRVHFSGQAARRFTGGLTELEVEANTFRRMVLELDRRYPGLGRQIEESMAVAIDGEIFQDAYLAQLKPESEIVLIPKIGGGYFLPLSLRGATGAAAISFAEIASPGTAHQGRPGVAMTSRVTPPAFRRRAYRESILFPIGRGALGCRGRRWLGSGRWSHTDPSPTA
jgi:sulfur-carrier protein